MRRPKLQTWALPDLDRGFQFPAPGAGGTGGRGMSRQGGERREGGGGDLISLAHVPIS